MAARPALFRLKQEAHVAAKNRQSDRQRAIQQIEFGELLACPRFALRQDDLCLPGFIAEHLFADGALQRDGKAGHGIFEDVIGRALLDAFNSGFFS